MHEIDLKKYLKKKGFKVTTQREKIVERFLKRDRHFSVEELYKEMKRTMPEIGFATVYRTLQLLVAVGLATERRFKDDITRFEPSHKDRHHDHMICLNCGRIIEFENHKIEKLQNDVAEKRNFYIVSHKLELYGYCEECKKKRLIWYDEKGGDTRDKGWM